MRLKWFLKMQTNPPKNHEMSLRRVSVFCLSVVDYCRNVCWYHMVESVDEDLLPLEIIKDSL